MTSSFISALDLQTVLIGLVVLLLIYILRQRWKNKKYKLPPGPPALPLIGNYEVLKAKFTFEIFNKLSKTYGPVMTLYYGPIRLVVLNDINVVTEALVKKKDDFAGRPYIASVQQFTDGGKDIIFANYSPTWKLHRKIAGKALRQYLVRNYLEEVVHASLNKCLNKMSTEHGSFDPEPYIGLIVYNILNAVCFRSSCDLDDPDFQRFMKLEQDSAKLMENGVIENVFAFLIKMRPTQKYKTLMGMFDEIKSMITKKFKEHKETFDPDNIRDFTDSLILARKEAEDEENTEILSQLTDSHLIQTITDIFRAGIDTSRKTLLFAVGYMAGLQDIQSKVQEELDRIVGEKRLPALKDRENLGYGEATLHEVMRLGLTAPVGVPHLTLCDTQVAGYDVPKGTMVMINHWGLHRDPNYWKDPEKFNPERFLDENGKLSMKPESWLPFSAGRRVCLGETVGKPELHLIFSSIFQRFKVTLPEGINPEMEVTGAGVIIQPAPYTIIVEDRRK